MIAEATGASTTVALTTPTATDVNSGIVTVDALLANFPIGTTILTWTATDAAGNSATTTQQITIQDTTAPLITLHGSPDEYVQINQPFINTGAIATDQVDGITTLTGAGTVNTAAVGINTHTHTHTHTNAARQGQTGRYFREMLIFGILPTISAASAKRCFALP